MRSTSLGARWATCALALAIFVPAAFANEKKSLSDCAFFTQTEKGEDAVEMKVRNACTIPLDCSLSWRVVCAPDSKKRRSVHPTDTKFSLEASTELSKDASATVCGDDAWTIDSVVWSCTPNKD